METQQTSIKKIGLNYGLVLGVVMALVITLLYVFSIESLTQWWVGVLTFLVALAIGIVAVAKAKSLLGGYMTFKEAFIPYFITMAVGLFISAITGILIFNVVDPEAAAYLQENIIEMSREMMEKFGAPESEIDKAIADMEGTNSYSIGSQLQSYLFQLVFYSIFGLLVALIFRRKDPNAIQ